MKKKLITVLLTLAMAVSMFSAVIVTASAVDAKDAVAKIDDVYYAKLQDAIDATEGKVRKTVVLLKDVTESVKMALVGHCLLDLNGHTITAAKGTPAAIENCGGSIEIIATNGGKVIGNEMAVYAHRKDATDSCPLADIIINSGEFYATVAGTGATLRAVNSGTFTIYGGSFYAAKDCVNISKVIYAGTDYEDNRLQQNPGLFKISGGYFDGRLSNSNWGIYAIIGGTFTIPYVSNFKEVNGVSVVNTEKPILPLEDAVCVGENVYNRESGRLLMEGYTTRVTAEGTEVVKVDAEKQTAKDILKSFFSSKNIVFVGFKTALNAVMDILKKFNTVK